MKRDSELYILVDINKKAQAGCRYKMSKDATTVDALKFVRQLIDNYNRNLARIDIAKHVNDEIIALRFLQENDIEGHQRGLVPYLPINSKLYIEGRNPDYRDERMIFSKNIGEVCIHCDDRARVERGTCTGIEISLDLNDVTLFYMTKRYSLNEYRIKKLKPFAKLNDFPLVDLNLYGSALKFNELDEAIDIASLPAWRSKNEPECIITSSSLTEEYV